MYFTRQFHSRQNIHHCSREPPVFESQLQLSKHSLRILILIHLFMCNQLAISQRMPSRYLSSSPSSSSSSPDSSTLSSSDFPFHSPFASHHSPTPTPNDDDDDTTSDNNNNNNSQTIIEHLDIDRLAKSRGFSIESHRILTRDRYVLTVHRLLNPSVAPASRRGVVILQHGILCASPFWLMNSSPVHDPLVNHNNTTSGAQHPTGSRAITSNSLAVALANAGYDVWLANFRGTQYSRGHLRHLNGTHRADSQDYWDFNVDTLMEFDLEAYVRYILHQTGSERYTFIGHSLGATVGLGSLLVHQNTYITRKLSCSVLMAPVASTQYMRGSLMPLFQLATLLYADLAPFPGTSHSFAAFARHGCLFAQRVCTWLASMFIGAKQQAHSKSNSNYGYDYEHQADKDNDDGDNNDGLASTTGNEAHTNRSRQLRLDRAEYHKHVNTFVLMMHQSISVHMLRHIVQVHVSGRLSRFNYGPELNLAKYGHRLAPSYDLAKVYEPRLHLAIVSGLSDAISTPEEIEWIAQQIRNNVATFEHIRVAANPFNHMDLIMSRDAGHLVNRRVIDFIERNQCFP